MVHYFRKGELLNILPYFFREEIENILLIKHVLDLFKGIRERPLVEEHQSRCLFREFECWNFHFYFFLR
ncbi:hypothetical protein CL689_04025 [Candidatus Saccharibacteria bacterium]|nr:hypothetical protein [Candidatus Saccharibacteria bacterium]